MRISPRLAVVLSVTNIALGCSGSSPSQVRSGPTTDPVGSSAGAGAQTGNAPPASPGASGSPALDVDAGSLAGTMSSSGGAAEIITSLPSGFQATDMGGYQLGAMLGSAGADSGGAGGSPSASGGAPAMNGNCGNILRGVARDFRGAADIGGNADFESPSFWGQMVTPNLVATQLGLDQKPVYASKCELGSASTSVTCPYGPETTTQANFNQWYRDTPDVNQPFVISLYLAPQPGGLFTFQSLHYFPLDNAGYGNHGMADDMMLHNFSFSTEIHTQFAYSGGETFQFQGDDDVWVFINGKMAVDLGGLHPRMLGIINLDASATLLGLQKGSVYTLDLFHAERHTDKSTFRIDTNLSFVNCGTVESGPK